MHSAIDLLNKVEERYPNIWLMADNVKNFSSKHGRYKEGSIFTDTDGTLLKFKLNKNGDIDFNSCLLAALVVWRSTKGIYKFHKNVYDALIETGISGDIPTNLFLRLPGYCVFIETPKTENMPLDIEGFWGYLSRKGKEDSLEIVCLLRHDKDVLNFQIPLKSSSVDDCVQAMFIDKDVGKDEKLLISHVLSSLISLLLYLCSEKPDIDNFSPFLPKVKRYGSKLKIRAAVNVQQWDVALRIGACFEKSKKNQNDNSGLGDSLSSSLRPHMRKAHWHSYWVGERGSQTISLKWLPPIPVNLDDETNLPAVIHAVGET